MAKININGQTIAENQTKKNSAKSASNAITGLINTLSGSMDPEARKNAQTITTLISLM